MSQKTVGTIAGLVGLGIAFGLGASVLERMKRSPDAEQQPTAAPRPQSRQRPAQASGCVVRKTIVCPTEEGAQRMWWALTTHGNDDPDLVRLTFASAGCEDVAGPAPCRVERESEPVNHPRLGEIPRLALIHFRRADSTEATGWAPKMLVVR